MKKIAVHLFVIFALLISSLGFAGQRSDLETVRLTDLPQTVQQTVRLIRQNGPFPYEKDGAVFGNYERILPKNRHGHYHEYTTATSRARNRGARRIVVGGNPQSSTEFYYTDNHYATFRLILFSGR